MVSNHDVSFLGYGCKLQDLMKSLCKQNPANSGILFLIDTITFSNLPLLVQLTYPPFAAPCHLPVR